MKKLVLGLFWTIMIFIICVFIFIFLAAIEDTASGETDGALGFTFLLGLTMFGVMIYKLAKSKKTQLPIQEQIIESDAFSKGFGKDDFIQIKSTKFPSKYLYPKKDITDTSHFFYGKKVVITGGFESFPFREELARLLWEVGADIDSGIGKKTELAIVGSYNVGPSKMQKIIEQGIKIIREEELNQHFKNTTINKFKTKQSEKRL